MAMVSSTAGAEPRPGSSRVSESSAGKLSSKMVSSLVSDSGWSSALLSSSSASASSGASLASLSSSSVPSCASSCTSTLESSKAISASVIWSRLSKASAHASASSRPIVSSFMYPPSSISGQHCTQKRDPIEPPQDLKSDFIYARVFECKRDEKSPRKASETLSGGSARHWIEKPGGPMTKCQQRSARYSACA